MYNFTSFAMVLNEVDKEMESVIPKTDCRLRPDIRAMENGEIGNQHLMAAPVKIDFFEEGGWFYSWSLSALYYVSTTIFSLS